MSYSYISIAYLAVICSLGGGCSAEYFDQSATSDHSSSDTESGKPGDGTEGLPGYLVKPELITVETTAAGLVIRGAAGTVSGSNLKKAKVIAWAVRRREGRDLSVEQVATQVVNSEGGFELRTGKLEVREFIVQASGAQNFMVQIGADGLSNSVIVNKSADRLIDSYKETDQKVSETMLLADQIEMRYMNKVPQLLSPEIEAQIELHNMAIEPTNFDGLDVFYYFTDDGLSPTLEVTSSTQIPSDQLTTEFNREQNYLRFSVEGDLMLEGEDHIRIRFIIRNESNGEFNQANDYSYIQDQTTKAVSTKVSGVLRGYQFWGDR